MNTTNGKIAEKSIASFINAFLYLLEKDDYNDITVTQIAQVAGLSRKTFYRLIETKKNLLKILFDKYYFLDFLQEVRRLQIHDYWAIVQLYFDFWEEKKHFLLLLKKNNLLPYLFDYSYEHSYAIFQEVHTDNDSNSFSDALPFLLAYSFGGLHSMLLKWIECEMTIPSTTLIEILKKCVTLEK